MKEAMFAISHSSYQDDKSKREFYDLSGEKNIFDYMSAAGKKAADKTSSFSTGLFDFNGLLNEKEIKDCSGNAQAGEKMIWYGFFSLCEQYSFALETVDRAILFSRELMPNLFEEMDLDKNNVSLVMALHHNRPSHYHVHFVFWEKRCGPEGYKKNGAVKKALPFDMRAEMIKLARSGEILDYSFDRSGSISFLKSGINIFRPDYSISINRELMLLAECLPNNFLGNYSDITAHFLKKRIDNITTMLLASDKRTARFYDNISFNLKNKQTNGYNDAFSFDNYIKTKVIDGARIIKTGIIEQGEVASKHINDSRIKYYANNYLCLAKHETKELMNNFHLYCLNATKICSSISFSLAENRFEKSEIKEKINNKNSGA